MRQRGVRSLIWGFSVVTALLCTSAHAVTTRNTASLWLFPNQTHCNSVREDFWVTLENATSTWTGVTLRCSGPNNFFNSINQTFDPAEGPGDAGTEYGPAFAIWTGLGAGTYTLNGTATGNGPNGTWTAGSADKSTTIPQ